MSENMTNIIIISVILLAVLGIFIGLLLGVAGKLFAVEVDERVVLVRDCLPGNNCGGCGYPGCDGLADAIVAGTAPVNGCPVGGAPVAAKIGEIMGVDAGAAAKKVAFVKCAGTCEKAKDKYNYVGIEDCRAAAAIPGAGGKACSFGCLGLGSCVSVCQFDAIGVVDGVAKVNRENCVACGACVGVCPQKIIKLVPKKNQVHVLCSSTDKGAVARKNCDNACIGCMKCTTVCNFDAIHVEDFLARIDADKCKSCGLCAAVCPTGAINSFKKLPKKEAAEKAAAAKKAKAEAAKAKEAAGA